MEPIESIRVTREPWNKGKLVGEKTSFKLKEIWAIRVRLQIASRCRDLALFNLAIDSKLRACDLMQLRVRDVCHGQTMASRALVLQQKDSTSGPIRNHRTDSRCSVGVDYPFQVEVRRFSVPESNTCVAALIHASVCSDRRFLGPSIGIGYHKLRHPHAQTDKSDADIPPHKEPACSSAAPGPYQAGKYSA